MKKGLIIVLSFVMILMLVPGTALAADSKSEITSAKQLEKVIRQNLVNGALPEAIQKQILDTTESDVIEKYISDKMEMVFETIEGMGGNTNLRMMPDGSGYAKEVYDFGNGCTLTMEFEEGKDGLEEFISSGMVPDIRPMASNGETVWKAYGNRYFTASAKVDLSIWKSEVSLENHYMLSEQGIDERYGNATTTVNGAAGGSRIVVGAVEISDGSARTKGASDVNMHVDFYVEKSGGTAGSGIITKRLSTTVGYVDHNYSTKQIKVKHSWSLS